ncbi:MAG TPA: hypothetical protein VF502_05655 [Stellaceae bacterium]
MVVGRIIGWLFIVAAAIVLLRDLMAWYATGAFAPIALGKLWFDIHPTSLELAQPAIQRHVATWLWDFIVLILLCWATLVFGGLGLVLLGAFGGLSRGARRQTRME